MGDGGGGTREGGGGRGEGSYGFQWKRRRDQSPLTKFEAGIF